ncbi:MAG: DNA polymerase III subunit delta [bacterium]|nr:DNA polymerase III subunit delta [bacterium]MDD5756864.1 DNA polymerase III subunit delta [bacterium]
MKYQDLLQQISKKEFAPVYFFSGDEEFLKKEALQLLYQSLITEDQKDFNYALLYGKETSARDILDQAQSLPFLSDRRLVVVQEIEKLGDKDKLQEYLGHPNPATCLVLVAGKMESRDRKHKLYSALKEFEVVFWPLFKSDLKKWVVQKFRSHQKTVDAAAVDFLIEAAGPELANLASEITKLVIALPDKKTITIAEAQKNIFRMFTENDKRLERSLAARNLDRALIALQHVVAEGKGEMYALWIISQAWRKLIVAKEMQSRQTSVEEIMKKFNIRKSDDQNEFKASLPQFNLAELVKKHKKIADTDKTLKSSNQDPLWVLEHLLIDLCG